jgi:hypothetical protein
MSYPNDTCQQRRAIGARRPGTARMATRGTRVRVSSDAVVSAYIHDIARSRADEQPFDSQPAVRPPISPQERAVA